MSEENADMASGRRGGWDMRVVFIERRRHWWWNAWRPATSTELYGFAETRADAWSAMNEAVSAAPVPDQLRERRARHTSGAA
jgi:hypothetical protein